MKEYTASVHVGFDISININAIKEELAWEKLREVAEHIKDNATIDCALPNIYDVVVDEVSVHENAITEV